MSGQPGVNNEYTSGAPAGEGLPQPVIVDRRGLYQVCILDRVENSRYNEFQRFPARVHGMDLTYFYDEKKARVWVRRA